MSRAGGTSNFHGRKMVKPKTPIYFCLTTLLVTILMLSVGSSFSAKDGGISVTPKVTSPNEASSQAITKSPSKDVKKLETGPLLDRRILPDLIVQKIYLTKDCRVAVTVENKGPGSLPDEVWTVPSGISADVYLYSNDGRYGGGSIWGFDVARNLQRPGGTATYVSNLTVDGTFHIRAVVDHNEKVTETSEHNNSREADLSCPDSPAAGNHLKQGLQPKEIGTTSRVSQMKNQADATARLRARSIVKDETILPVKGRSPVTNGGPAGMVFAGKELLPIYLLLPRGGEYKIPGGRTAVHWETGGSDSGPISSGDWTIRLKKEGAASVNEVLFTGVAATETTLWVDLPRGLENGDDYYIHIADNADANRFGRGREFTIGPARDSEYVPSEDRSVTIIAPRDGEVLYKRNTQTFRWTTHPAILPMPDRCTVTLLPNSPGINGFVETIYPSHLSFDTTTRIYSWDRYMGSVDPGNYRVRIIHYYDELDGSGLSGSFIGQSELITVAEPAGDGVSLLEPHPGISVHAGEAIPFRWEISPEWITAYGTPDHVTIRIFDNNNDEMLACEHPADVGPAARMSDLPIPDTTPEGEYTASISVGFAGDFIVQDSVSGITVLPSEGLFFTWPITRGTLTYGHMYPITWNARGDAAYRNVSIYLMHGGAIVKELATGVPAIAGRWEWNLDINCNDEPVVPEGTDHYFRLVSDGRAPFEADSYRVDIFLPELRFNRGSPRAADSWPRGANRQVLWSPENVPEGATLKIDLLKEGRFEAQLATGVPANRDYYTWERVGQISSTHWVPADDDYSFRLVLESCDAVVSESPRFSIVAE